MQEFQLRIGELLQGQCKEMMIFPLVSEYEIKRKSLMIIWNKTIKGKIIMKMKEWIFSNSNRFRQFNTGLQRVEVLEINEKKFTFLYIHKIIKIFCIPPSTQN